mmetsp:Transcript_16546/g.45058  ORF Transcript_16546/g.45058 Transcript_16546/m.45058 type:complete len:144 (+) Transcript_16546:381-812(+)
MCTDIQTILKHFHRSALARAAWLSSPHEEMLSRFPSSTRINYENHSVASRRSPCMDVARIRKCGVSNKSIKQMKKFARKYLLKASKKCIPKVQPSSFDPNLEEALASGCNGPSSCSFSAASLHSRDKLSPPMMVFPRVCDQVS